MYVFSFLFFLIARFNMRDTYARWPNIRKLHTLPNSPHTRNWNGVCFSETQFSEYVFLVSHRVACIDYIVISAVTRYNLVLRKCYIYVKYVFLFLKIYNWSICFLSKGKYYNTNKKIFVFHNSFIRVSACFIHILLNELFCNTEFFRKLEINILCMCVIYVRVV